MEWDSNPWNVIHEVHANTIHVTQSTIHYIEPDANTLLVTKSHTVDCSKYMPYFSLVKTCLTFRYDTIKAYLLTRIHFHQHRHHHQHQYHHPPHQDPVTGSAHTVLAPYWSTELEKKQLVARQVGISIVSISISRRLSASALSEDRQYQHYQQQNKGPWSSSDRQGPRSSTKILWKITISLRPGSM